VSFKGRLLQKPNTPLLLALLAVGLLLFAFRCIDVCWFNGAIRKWLFYAGDGYYRMASDLWSSVCAINLVFVGLPYFKVNVLWRSRNTISTKIRGLKNRGRDADDGRRMRENVALLECIDACAGSGAANDAAKTLREIIAVYYRPRKWSPDAYELVCQYLVPCLCALCCLLFLTVGVENRAGILFLFPYPLLVVVYMLHTAWIKHRFENAYDTVKKSLKAQIEDFSKDMCKTLDALPVAQKNT